MTKIEVGKCYETPDPHQIVRVYSIHGETVFVGNAGLGIYSMETLEIPLSEFIEYWHEVNCDD